MAVPAIVWAIVEKLFNMVFDISKNTTKEAAKKIGPQICDAIQTVSKIGIKQLKEFLVALPMFVFFVRELLRNRDQIQAQKQLMIIGAGASLSTLGLIALGTTLGSIFVQAPLLFAHPIIGIPLLFSEGVVLAAIMVFLVWLIVYVLNRTLDDDPYYRQIRDQLLPPSTQDMMDQIKTELEQSGADLDSIREVIEERLKARGSKADAKELEKELQNLENRLRKWVADRLSKVGKDAQPATTTE